MKKLRVILTAVLLSAISIAVLLAAAYLLSRYRATGMQMQHLSAHSQAALERAEMTYGDALNALKEADARGWTDCSPAHIEAMRLAAFNHPSVSEVGFIQNGRLACTSWGVVDQFVPHLPHTFSRSDGVGIRTNIKPAIVPGNTAVAVDYRSHNALVEPSHLIDVITGSGVGLALTNEGGQVVSTINHPPLDLVSFAVQHPGEGVHGHYLYSSSRKDGWVTVAVEDRAFASLESQHQQVVLYPAALVVAAIAIAVIFLFTVRRLSPRAALEMAVRKREFVAFYQPIIELGTQACVGAEALVRWEQPDGTAVAPNLFLPLAEESGLIRPITDQMIEMVIEDMHGLMRESGLHISINLSSQDMESGRPLPLIARLLAKRGVPEECLWLEATERGFMNADQARATLERARAQGHKIAIDDFGTGYSSLSLLHSLPLDALKIDKIFIEAIGTESATSTVISHIIDMARELDLTTIAEGIETEEQAAYLRGRNVKFGQGYLFARPMPRDEFIAFYRNCHRKQTSGS